VNVRTKLVAAFLANIAVLIGLALYDVEATQHTVRSARQLTEMASRLQLTSTLQLSRINQISPGAEKYLVTRDTDYAKNLRDIVQQFDNDLTRFDSFNLTPVDRAQVQPLRAAWSNIHTLTDQLVGVRDADTALYRARLQAAVDEAQERTATLGDAAQKEMDRELDAAKDREQAAEQAAVIATTGAVLLAIVLYFLLARSIIEPLDKLAHGTREVSAGRFGHRLRAKGRDEFAQVAREFNSMTERLEELDRLKREFVSKVSHDLKTPLSSMQETTRVILDEVAGPVTPKQRQLLAINLESGERLAGMLGKLLDLSRMESGPELDFQSIDVPSILHASVERLGEGLRGDRIALSVSTLPQRLVVEADPEALAQVFDNLLENALKFSPPDATVAVHVEDLTSRGDAPDIPTERWLDLQRTAPGTDAVLVSVSDVGPGVPDDEKERVFVRFYQTDAGRAVRARGVGLGLAICREIVASHGGTIWVADNHPRGSVFNVLLPATARVASETRAPALSRDPAHRA